MLDKLAVLEAKLALLEKERAMILEWLRARPQVNCIHAAYRGHKGRRDLTATRRTFSFLSAALKPRSALMPKRRLSPSRR